MELDSLKKKNEELKQELSQLKNREKELEMVLNKITSAKAFKLWQGFNKFKKLLKQAILDPRKILKISKIFILEGPSGVIEKIKSQEAQRNQVLTINQQYQLWLKKNYPTEEELKRQRRESKKFKYRPKISIITPVYNTPKKFLKECIESVLNQTYDNWELCLADDASTKSYVKKVLEEYKNKDKRIKVVYRKKNGHICRASNSALKIATGEFVGLLDHDDVLWPNALYEVVKLLNEKPDAQFIYSDEDKIDEDGKTHLDPFFKPDWSLDLLLSMNYITHFSVIKKSLVDGIKGFRVGYEGSQDYDLFLRVIDRTKNIYHIPKILYSWRMSSKSTAANYRFKEYAEVNAIKALSSYIKRHKMSATVEKISNFNGRFRIRYVIKNKPKVTIIVLTGGKINLLDKCLNSILQKSTYKNYSILIVDNSLKKKTQKYLKEVRQKYPKKIRFYKDDLKPFNFSALYNKAFKKIKSKYAIILNDDIEIITPDWIESMLEHCQRKEVAVVGCKLLYPDGRIQHAGVFMGVYGNTGHCFKGIRNDIHYYFDLPHVIRNVSAVTFACAMVKTKIYKELGGLDEKNLKVAFNDVDFCLRVIRKGYKIIYTPYVMLYHFESVTKPIHFLPGEPEYMKRKWKDIIKHDPFYNPNLTREKEDYSLRI